MGKGLSRREFLTIAATAPIALQTIGLVHAAESQTRLPLITLFLSGGASAKETFNPDPRAIPAEFRGPLRSIPTRTTGMHFSELFPRLAEQSDQFAVLRALDSGSSDHEASQQTAILSGNRTISEIIGDGTAQSVPYVLLNPGSNWPGVRSAFRIASSFGPMWDARQRKFTAPPPVPPSAGSPPNLAQRRSLLRTLDSSPSYSPVVDRMRRFQETAFDLLLGGGQFFEALDLPERDRERYGRTLAGDMTLLAKRFVERGAGAVTIYHEPEDVAWDAHNNLQRRYQTMAPEIDRAASALIDEIARNRLECVLLLMGEFNRTPQMNGQAGRDHWQYGNCAILVGGHTRKDAVFGRTNPQGQITNEGVQQCEVLGNTVLLATGVELMPTKPRVREILT